MSAFPRITKVHMLELLWLGAVRMLPVKWSNQCAKQMKYKNNNTITNSYAIKSNTLKLYYKKDS
jgi:hypothetical protein